ncbi:MAG: dienelactone hydrolase family protein [Halobacteria archaeon]
MKPPLLPVLLALLLASACIQSPPAAPATPPAPSATNVEALTRPGGLEVRADNLSYFEGAAGYLARPAAPGAYPGVVMIHEWWGLNDNIRAMARQLASEGYAVLAVDLFGSVAATPDEARRQVSSLNATRAVENLRAAAAHLRAREGAPRIASLGWCFGGGQSLQLALSGEPLAATVIYYGSLVNDSARLSAIRWPVLGVFGDKDASIPVSRVQEFDRALDSLSIPNEIHVYPGVGHAFANPSGANYAPNQTQDAWAKTVAFLDRNLKGA